MSQRSTVIYRYDGSFDGLLCCVFRAIAQKEEPMDIQAEEDAQATLLPVVEVVTRADQAQRVLRSIPEKLGPSALRCVKLAFLSGKAGREIAILDFLRLGYRVGPHIMGMLADPRVDPVVSAARNVLGEAHLLKGFTRFSQYGGVLAAEIEPKNHVLPILGSHFRARMPGESFLIHDRIHGMVLACSGGVCRLFPVTELELPEAEPMEKRYRRLWTRFYDTVGIESRYNPQCRMTQMPKRYWGLMTEFQNENRFDTLPR